jgi:hypothetical protein
MNTQRRIVVLVSVLTALLLVAAGCGGSDSSEEARSDETTVETTVETSDEATDEATSDDDSTSAAGIFASEDCVELASIGAKIAQAVDPSGSFDADEAAAFYDELAAKAPEEIRDDLEVFAGYLAEVAAALEGIDLTSGEVPSPDDLAKLQEVAQSADAEVQEAADNLSAWAEENCSIGG